MVCVDWMNKRTVSLCPADGRFLNSVKLKRDIFRPKVKSFSVEKLIGDPQLAKPFINGQFATGLFITERLPPRTYAIGWAR